MIDRDPTQTTRRQKTQGHTHRQKTDFRPPSNPILTRSQERPSVHSWQE